MSATGNKSVETHQATNAIDQVIQTAGRSGDKRRSILAALSEIETHLENRKQEAYAMPPSVEEDLKFLYKNHKNEIAWRTLRAEYGIGIYQLQKNTEHHKIGTWVLHGFCQDRKAVRSFALSNILAFEGCPTYEEFPSQKRLDVLETAIRKHMNVRGDDRCHQDDHELYSVLPEGDTRPERDTAVTLENCQRYIKCRQQGREYISPQRRIEELEHVVLALLRSHDGVGGDIYSVVDMAKRAMRHLPAACDMCKGVGLVDGPIICPPGTPVYVMDDMSYKMQCPSCKGSKVKT